MNINHYELLSALKDIRVLSLLLAELVLVLEFQGSPLELE